MENRHETRYDYPLGTGVRMTNKIPVGQTIARAYGFAFGNILTNLALIWVPVAILWAIGLFVYAPYMMANMPAANANPMAMLGTMRFVFLYGVVAMVLLTAQIAVLTQEALGLREGASFLQFPFGAATWRTLGAFLLFFLVIFVIYIGIFLVGAVGGVILAVIAAQSGGSNKMIVGLLVFAFAILVICALLYIIVRLSFFLAPVAVAEKRVSLIRAWQLGQGNFWRMFAVNLSIWIPLLILEAGFIYWMWGTSFLLPLHGTPDQIAEFTRHQQEPQPPDDAPDEQPLVHHLPAGSFVWRDLLRAGRGRKRLRVSRTCPGRRTDAGRAVIRTLRGLR